MSAHDELPDLGRDGPLQRTAKAIDALLDPAFPAKWFAREPVPPRMSSDAWKRLTRRTPFVGIGWGGWRPSERCGNFFAADALFSALLVVAEKTVALRQSNLMGMVQVAVAALHGVRIGADADTLGTLMVRDVEQTYDETMADEDQAIARITVSVNTGILSDPGRIDALADFLRLGVDWSGQFPDLHDDIRLGDR